MLRLPIDPRTWDRQSGMQVCTTLLARDGVEGVWAPSGGAKPRRQPRKKTHLWRTARCVRAQTPRMLTLASFVFTPLSVNECGTNILPQNLPFRCHLHGGCARLKGRDPGPAERVCYAHILAWKLPTRFWRTCPQSDQGHRLFGRPGVSLPSVCERNLSSSQSIFERDFSTSDCRNTNLAIKLAPGTVELLEWRPSKIRFWQFLKRQFFKLKSR